MGRIPVFLRKSFKLLQALSGLSLESTQVSGGKLLVSEEKPSSFENPPVSENLKFQNLKSPNFMAQSSRFKAQDSKTSGTEILRSRKTSSFEKILGFGNLKSPKPQRLKIPIHS